MIFRNIFNSTTGWKCLQQQQYQMHSLCVCACPQLRHHTIIIIILELSEMCYGKPEDKRPHLSRSTKNLSILKLFLEGTLWPK